MKRAASDYGCSQWRSGWMTLSWTWLGPILAMEGMHPPPSFAGAVAEQGYLPGGSICCVYHLQLLLSPDVVGERH